MEVAFLYNKTLDSTDIRLEQNNKGVGLLLPWFVPLSHCHIAQLYTTCDQLRAYPLSSSGKQLDR